MKKVILFLLVTLLILSGCSIQFSDNRDALSYNGKSLDIGVIGDAPTVKEQNIKFSTISFKNFEDTEKLYSQFDAVFIMKDYLSQAAKGEYAKVYKNSSIPFFFIESKKSYMPFLFKDLSYEECTFFDDQPYATGYFNNGEKGQSIEYGLYNDEINEANIQDAYSRIFNTIENIEDKSIDNRKINNKNEVLTEYHRGTEKDTNSIEVIIMNKGK